MKALARKSGTRLRTWQLALGDVIAIFRETEASLGQYQAILAIPAEKRPEHPVVVDPLRDLGFESVSFTHLTAS